MSVPWIEWGETAGELAKHLGNKFEAGLQMDVQGRTPPILVGNCFEDHEVYIKRVNGREFVGPSTPGCGCCSTMEFREGDIILRYRIWPVNE